MWWRYYGLSFLVCGLCLLTLSGGPRQQGRPMRILCLGEGELMGDQTYDLWRLLERSGVPAHIFNETRANHNSWDFLQFFKAHYYRLRDLHPDLVLIQLGLADTRPGPAAVPTYRFYNNVLHIIRMARTFLNPEGQPSILMIATLPQLRDPPPYPYNANSIRRIRAEINPAIRDVALRETLVLIRMDDLTLNPSGVDRRLRLRRWYQAMMPYLGIRILPTLEEIWQPS